MHWFSSANLTGHHASRACVSPAIGSPACTAALVAFCPASCTGETHANNRNTEMMDAKRMRWSCSSSRWFFDIGRPMESACIGSPGLFAPNPCSGAIGTAALTSYDALIIDLGSQHASTVPHNHSTFRVHSSFPIIWCGLDDALCDRQRKRNAVLPAFEIIAGGRVCSPTILSRYAGIRTVEQRCCRSGGLCSNRHC